MIPVQWQLIGNKLKVTFFTSAELMGDKFGNIPMGKITIIRNKIISYSPNNTSNIALFANTMFTVKMLMMFLQFLKLSSQI